MMKMLISSALLVATLCGPALADGTPPVRPAPPAQPLDVTMVVNTGNQPRKYVMKLLDDTCGTASSKNPGKLEDAILLCANDGAQLRLVIDWSTRDGVREFHNKSTVVAKPGSTFDIEGDGAKLTVSVK